MCGIIGIVSQQNVVPLLLNALSQVEYRGYDSAGVATLQSGMIERRRAEGKLLKLAELVAREPLAGTLGIGHTRWATHGKPSEANAHPHASRRVALVHNGIIENFAALKAELLQAGCVFESETDSEVVVQLLTKMLDEGMTPLAAVKAVLTRLEGAFALAIMFAGAEKLLVGARRGSPLAVGLSADYRALGSDALALAGLADEIIYLQDGDWCVLTDQTLTIYDAHNNEVTREKKPMPKGQEAVGKGGYQHYMLKEIYEQPTVVGDALNAMVPEGLLPSLPWAKVPRLAITACGTSFYAGLTARYWFESFARLPTDVEIASEFRYRQPVLTAGGATLAISQSGETADTLAALHYAKSQGQNLLGLVNVPESSIARLVDDVYYTYAGKEVGVASTKAFSTQLAVLAVLALAAGVQRGTLSESEARQRLQELQEMPRLMQQVLANDEAIINLAAQVAQAKTVLYLGRDVCYPLALEGALKLKEISYIHAEGFAAGEMKHGPIALIDNTVPVVALAPTGPLQEKVLSNIEEAAARNAQIILIADAAAQQAFNRPTLARLTMPAAPAWLTPLLYILPLQLLAYHVAAKVGSSIDQPRNLAKSVTVE